MAPLRPLSWGHRRLWRWCWQVAQSGPVSPHRARGGWDLMQMSPSSPRDSLEPRGIVPCLQLGQLRLQQDAPCGSPAGSKGQGAGFPFQARPAQQSRQGAAAKLQETGHLIHALCHPPAQAILNPLIWAAVVCYIRALARPSLQPPRDTCHREVWLRCLLLQAAWAPACGCGSPSQPWSALESESLACESRLSS